ncbi:MAG: dockerin type I domain-containing protein, partial [Clostridiales bacterium]|nr:dockerin type I domain-containing protein [Clostridiales bacterium]
VFAYVVPASFGDAAAAPAAVAFGEAGGAIAGDGVYVEVDDSMSMTVYRIEKDGTKVPMTQKPAPITPTALTAAAQAAWNGKLPWSVGTGTADIGTLGTGSTTRPEELYNELYTRSALLLSDKSGYVTTGTRSDGSNVGNEAAIDDFAVTDVKNETNVTTYFGPGDRLTVTGKSAAANLVRILVVETSYSNTGVVSVTSKYRYDGAGKLNIARFVENNYKIYDPLPADEYVVNKREAGLWTQQGSVTVQSRDYVMPVFNTMGTRATSPINSTRAHVNDMVSRNNWFWGENGGLPFNDFYGENVGILIGSAMPHMVRGLELPTRGSGITDKHDTAYTWVGWPGQELESGVLTDVGTSIVGVHTGDYFQANRQFASAMAFIPDLVINGEKMPSDWLALPDPNELPSDAWMNTWESWGGNEAFDPVQTMDYADDGSFAAMGIKYLILDAGWYPRGTISRGGANLEQAQRGGEGGYIAQPDKWKTVGDKLGLPCETEADAIKVCKAFNEYLQERGFKVAAWVMPSSVYLYPGSIASSTYWSDDGESTRFPNYPLAAVGAEIDPLNAHNLYIETEYTKAHPDYFITANAAEYDPATGQLKPGSPRPWYVRQCGYTPQMGTADLCLGNPRVMDEYVDYFCNLMFEQYSFDGLKIDTQWGTQACYALGHGHDGNPNAPVENYAKYWKKIYDRAKEIKGNDIWFKHCCCGTMMNFFNNNGTNRPITGDPGSGLKVRYSIRMWKGLYGDNAPAVSDHVENIGAIGSYTGDVDTRVRRSKMAMGVGYVLETKMWPAGGEYKNPTQANPNATSVYGTGNVPTADMVKMFPLAVEEGISSGYYLDLYKYGFDYPEAYAYDKPEKNTKYYAFYATNYNVSAYNTGANNQGAGAGGSQSSTAEMSLTYSGPVELRGLEPGMLYTVKEYVDNTYEDVLQADAFGTITLDIDFTECVLLKTVPVKAVYANLSADAESDIDKDVCYTLSISKAEDVLLVELEFEVDGNMLAGKGIKTDCGFLPMSDIFWSYAGDSIWKGTVTLSLPSGSTTGLTSVAPVDIATFVFAPRAAGDAAMTLTGFRAVGLEDTTVYLESVILNSEAVTNVDQRVFSKYDLNRDNKVDALDLGIMLLYCGFATGTPGWDTLVKVNDSRGKGVTASMCDVNCDGIIDMLDLLDLFIHYTK